MEIHLKHIHPEVSEKVREHAERKITRLSNLLGYSAGSAHAYLEINHSTGAHQSGKIWQASISLDANGKRYNAAAQSNTPLRAADTAIYELKAELKKSHAKDRSIAKREGSFWKNLFQGV